MFGYVTVNKADLSQEEEQRYKQVYCGLCREIGRRHGQVARFCLNYDMAFLVLILESLYEPETKNEEARCFVHPQKKNSYSVSEMTSYAADMTIALTYHKCMDDWKDERKVSRYGYAGMLKKSYREIQKKWPRQCEAIETCMHSLAQIESEAGGMDASANCFGALMAELFIYQEDIWSKPLRQFGNCLGRFIYLMDAVIDYEEDIKKGNYNPIVADKKTQEETEELLTIQMGMAAEIFEKLPLVEDAHLLRSIIYAGVWQKYQEKTKTN